MSTGEFIWTALEVDGAGSAKGAALWGGFTLDGEAIANKQPSADLDWSGFSVEGKGSTKGDVVWPSFEMAASGQTGNQITGETDWAGWSASGKGSSKGAAEWPKFSTAGISVITHQSAGDIFFGRMDVEGAAAPTTTYSRGDLLWDPFRVAGSARLDIEAEGDISWPSFRAAGQSISGHASYGTMSWASFTLAARAVPTIRTESAVIAWPSWMVDGSNLPLTAPADDAGIYLKHYRGM